MEALTPIQQVLVVISGVLVGFILGLIGGGGSILAVPLLLYFVGYSHLHCERMCLLSPANFPN
jgi:uncharacterized membrane protein YfcA